MTFSALSLSLLASIVQGAECKALETFFFKRYHVFT